MRIIEFIKDSISKHYDLHILLGIGIGFIVASFQAPMFIHVVTSGLLAFGGGFILEGYQGMIKKAITDNNDFWCTKIKTDLVILPDDVFRDFVKLSTEVQARIRINNETKTVDKGALFYEEALPSDTLLYSVIMVHDPACDSSRRPAGLRDFNDVMAFLCTLNGNRLQLGGDVTIGRGILNLNVLNGGK